MASAELKELVELAKEAGLEGTELSNFLRDERTRLREREKEEREREEKERERQREREKEEGELRREREKAEAEALQRDADRHHEMQKKIKTVSSCPHYHTATRKMANYNILNKVPSFAPRKTNSDVL